MTGRDDLHLKVSLSAAFKAVWARLDVAFKNRRSI